MHLGASINTPMKVRIPIKFILPLEADPETALIWETVYNHVLKLDLHTLQWTLVDNYGDIPGVRMGKYEDMTEL